MKERMNQIVTRIDKSGIIAMLMLAVVTLAEQLTDVCIIWIFGQDDMPEELL